MDLAQPHVSRHLRVLREVGAVDVREDGRQRLYRLNGPALRPIHEWVTPFEQFWNDRMTLLTDVVTDLMANDPSTVRNPKRK
jgi:DNA-binding transcriptional ArsR family regulator